MHALLRHSFAYGMLPKPKQSALREVEEYISFFFCELPINTVNQSLSFVIAFLSTSTQPSAVELMSKNLYTRPGYRRVNFSAWKKDANGKQQHTTITLNAF